ncbi:hypothetical protein BJ912DRAFT_932377 [Pholiota molesta]|nr:hypothetical protein BJ912DRAFT_932377 [Pholiota molesta]
MTGWPTQQARNEIGAHRLAPRKYERWHCLHHPLSALGATARRPRRAARGGSKIKAWLESFGVEGLQWVSMWDEGGSITLDGTKPRRSYPEGMDPVPISYYGNPFETNPSE